MPISRYITATFFIVLALLPAEAVGECVRTSPATMLEFSDLVVAGVLVGVRDSVDVTGEDKTEWKILTIEPTVVWKGHPHPTYRILCAWDCLPDFGIRRSCLIYASRRHGEYFTGRCWRNKAWDDAAFDQTLLPEPLWVDNGTGLAPVAPEDMVALLDHTDRRTAEEAARDFMWLPNAGIVEPLLVDVMRNPNSRRPQLAALALTHIDAREALPDLEWAYNTGQPTLAAAVLAALAALDDNAKRRCDRLRGALRHRSPIVRRQAVNLLADEATRSDGGLTRGKVIRLLRDARRVESDADVVLAMDVRVADLSDPLD